MFSVNRCVTVSLSLRLHNLCVVEFLFLEQQSNWWTSTGYNYHRYNNPSEKRSVSKATDAVVSGQVKLEMENPSVPRSNRVSLGSVNPGYNEPPVQRTPGYNEHSRWAPPWRIHVKSRPVQRIPGYNEPFARVQKGSLYPGFTGCTCLAGHPQWQRASEVCFKID